MERVREGWDPRLKESKMTNMLKQFTPHINTRGISYTPDPPPTAGSLASAATGIVQPD